MTADLTARRVAAAGISADAPETLEETAENISETADEFDEE
jgi:hypothetical protein